LTLIETVIAMAVALLTIALYVQTFARARSSAEQADDQIKAVHYTRLNMEMLLTNSYTSAALGITNRPNWVTNYSVSGNATTLYVCSYVVVTGAYPRSRVIMMTNRWLSLLSKKTNSTSMATAVCSGFQY
jgi:type II secretory pathway pseudopilin PulG